MNRFKILWTTVLIGTLGTLMLTAWANRPQKLEPNALAAEPVKEYSPRSREYKPPKKIRIWDIFNKKEKN